MNEFPFFLFGSPVGNPFAYQPCKSKKDAQRKGPFFPFRNPLIFFLLFVLSLFRWPAHYTRRPKAKNEKEQCRERERTKKAKKKCIRLTTMLSNRWSIGAENSFGPLTSETINILTNNLCMYEYKKKEGKCRRKHQRNTIFERVKI